MKGEYTKRKLNNLVKAIQRFPHEVRRTWVKLTVRNKDFSIISNNCWGGRVYQYLDMPYLSPTAGLYFFAPDYVKFVSDLHRYLNLPLAFIPAEESKYYEELKKRNQTDKPIGKLDDIEIIFLHYKTREEAEEKWNRRKERVNFNHIILKFSRMNLCTDKEIKAFDKLEFQNKFVLNNRRPLQFNSEVYWKEKWDDEGIHRDTLPFPGNINLKSLLNKKSDQYPKKGLV